MVTKNILCNHSDQLPSMQKMNWQKGRKVDKFLMDISQKGGLPLELCLVFKWFSSQSVSYQNWNILQLAGFCRKYCLLVCGFFFFSFSLYFKWKSTSLCLLFTKTQNISMTESWPQRESLWARNIFKSPTQNHFPFVQKTSTQGFARILHQGK